MPSVTGSVSWLAQIWEALTEYEARIVSMPSVTGSVSWPQPRRASSTATVPGFNALSNGQRLVAAAKAETKATAAEAKFQCPQ